MATEIITPMQIYWLTRFSSLKCGLAFFIFLLLALAVGYLIAGVVLQDDVLDDSDHERGIKLIKKAPFLAAVAGVFIMLHCLLPTTREMAAILIVPRIANNEKVQTVGNHLYDLAVEWMEELSRAKNKNGSEKKNGY